MEKAQLKLSKTYPNTVFMQTLQKSYSSSILANFFVLFWKLEIKITGIQKYSEGPLARVKKTV